MMTKKKARFRASKPQVQFVNSDDKFPLFLAGLGSGKTEALILKIFRERFRYKKAPFGVYLPSYDLIKMIYFPRMEVRLNQLGIKYRFNKSDFVLKLDGMGDIYFRSMAAPERIIGYEVAKSFVDELDTLKLENAKLAFEKIIARNRYKIDGINNISVATTPEGYNFCYETWGDVKVQEELLSREKLGYKTFRASTYSNQRNLPDDYIDTMKANYSPQLFEAYVNGFYVNLNAGAIYINFNRLENQSQVEIIPGEDLFIGMDFNILKMSAVVCVIRDNNIHVVDEIYKCYNTDEMIEIIKTKYQGHRKIIYCDPAGAQRKSSAAAGVTDISLLKQSGFYVKADKAHPLVRDRINSVNSAFLNAQDDRRLFINSTKCKNLVKCLETQCYDPNGQPEKNGKDLDHLPDSLGYLVHKILPCKKPVAARQASM